MRVRVWWTHQTVQADALRGWTVAVVDCLRATTTIAAALAAGCTAVTPMREESAARSLAAARNALLAGERNCVPPAGFALGNSPAEFTTERVDGREVVLWTTNGSQALRVAVEGGASDVLAFGLVNLAATARYLRQCRCRQLAVVCAGTEGEFSLEDAFTAGALLEGVAGEGDGGLEADERGHAALLLYRGGRGDARGVFDATRAAAKLRAHGLGTDVAYAVRQDALDVIALWRDGALRAAGAEVASCGSSGQ